MIRFSRTVSSVSSVSSCGTTPSRARIAGPSCTGSRPRIVNAPADGGETQPIMRIVELFPAPFGPRKPNASPRETSKSTPSTATSDPNCLRSSRAWINGASALTSRTLARADLELRGCALERFRELFELELVTKGELDAAASNLRVEAGEGLQRRAHARRKRRVDGDRTHARLLLRAGPLRTLLRRPHGQALLHDLARETPAPFVIGHGEHRTRVAFRELPALDHAEHVVRQIEQADAVRHRRLRASDAFCDLAEREAELVEQYRVGPRFLHRRQLLARDVLDQSEQQRVAVIRLAHDRGNRRMPGLTCRTPAALTRDDLVAPGRTRPHEQRLDHALAADRLREPRARLGVEALAGLLRVGMDRVDRQLKQLGCARLEAADEHLEAAAEAAAVRRARQAPSPPSSTRPLRRNGGRRRSPASRGSALPRGGSTAARRS